MCCDISTKEVLQDVYQFIAENINNKTIPYKTFVASFKLPIAVDEDNFEKILWQQLQMLHNLDSKNYDWDQKVSNDVYSNEFSFSLGEHSFFIAGLCPGNRNISRRFILPTLVFNLHEQFDYLRENNKFAPMRNAIRKRNSLLQPDLLSHADDFGNSPESKQYSGKFHTGEWICPFIANKK